MNLLLIFSSFCNCICYGLVICAIYWIYFGYYVLFESALAVPFFVKFLSDWILVSVKVVFAAFAVVFWFTFLVLFAIGTVSFVSCAFWVGFSAVGFATGI